MPRRAPNPRHSLRMTPVKHIPLPRYSYMAVTERRTAGWRKGVDYFVGCETPG